MRALGVALRRWLAFRDQVDEPLRSNNRIDVAKDGVWAPFAHTWRDDDVAVFALDRNALGERPAATAERLLIVPFEDHMRAAGGGAMLSRLERLMLGEQRVPGGDAFVFVLYRGVDVAGPHARQRPHSHSDQRTRIFFPPLRDDDGIAGRLFDTAGSGNAFLELAG